LNHPDRNTGRTLDPRDVFERNGGGAGFDQVEGSGANLAPLFEQFLQRESHGRWGRTFGIVTAAGAQSLGFEVLLQRRKRSQAFVDA